MYGFTVTKNLRLANQDIVFNNYKFANYLIKKFGKDKIFKETENFIVVVDGVVLNKADLLPSGIDWCEELIELYEKNGETFFSVFRGIFSGAFYDKKLDKLIVFSDQLGQKFIYYWHERDRFMVSSMLPSIYDELKRNNINYSLSEDAALQLLSYGFMLDNNTLCSEIKKIRPGCYIVLENDTVTEKEYYRVSNKPIYRRSEDELIEDLDRLFRVAVKRQFEKDKEYGYKHICELSAGLDCRLVCFVANELGYTDQLNVTFSQNDYWDDIVPKKMAADMRHEWIFKSLDNGLWLYNIDDITKTTGGSVIYHGSAHAYSLYRCLNFNEFGVLHSGNLGDAVLACHVEDNNEQFVNGRGAFSNRYLPLIETKLNYENADIGMWYIRYLNGNNAGQQIVFNYTETFSPYLDLDFMEYCLSIPCNLRADKLRLFKKWILKKYPQAAKYVWERFGARIDAPMIKIGRRHIPFITIPRRLFNYVARNIGLKGKETSVKSMNPVAYYLSTNNDLCKFIDSYLCSEEGGGSQTQ